VKDRPCAVVLMLQNDEKGDVVTVLPITHTPPSLTEADLAVEIPAQTKRRLGLDDAPSWIMLTEANRFNWPGPDLRMVNNGDTSSVVYGFLPERLFEHVRVKFLAALKARKSRLVQRTD
jgi:PemK-like, MazF-like toxin of type II toxin-antitoxin system